MENVNIYKKLLEAQRKFTAVVFDSKNPHFKSQFASLKSMLNATKDALMEHGFVVLQPWKTTAEGNILLITRIVHETGNSIDSECLIVRGNKTDQQLGSSVTYMRRYQYASLLNLVAEEEDDGEANEERNKDKQSPYIAHEPKKTAPTASTEPTKAVKEWKPATKPAKELEVQREPVTGNAMGKLKYLLLEKDVSITELEEYLLFRSKKSGYTIEKTIEAIMSSPDMTTRFVEMYQEWMESLPVPY